MPRLIPVNEFARKIGFDKLIQSKFKTNDSASFRYHTDTENLMQKIYQTVAAYFQDDDADVLIHVPVFNAILGKKDLASQSTISRFINRCDDICLMQFEQIQQILRKRIYSIKKPEQILIPHSLPLLVTKKEMITISITAIMGTILF